MEPIAAPREREERFREVYDAVYIDLLRFVRRHVHPTHAEDVVGDVMLVAWRRLDDVPADESDARAWLFGVARKTLQNARRREDRHDAVAIRLAELRPSADAKESGSTGRDHPRNSTSTSWRSTFSCARIAVRSSRVRHRM